MQENSFDFGEDPCGAEGIKQILSQNVVKMPISVSVFFPTLERYLRSYIDQNAKLPSLSFPYIYANEEGLIAVLAVTYSVLRMQGKCVCFTKEQDASDFCFSFFTEYASVPCAESRAESERRHALSALAHHAGFALNFRQTENRLWADFSCAPFRAVPVSAYSCSENFVQETVERALRLFFG